MYFEGHIFDFVYLPYSDTSTVTWSERVSQPVIKVSAALKPIIQNNILILTATVTEAST